VSNRSRKIIAFILIIFAILPVAGIHFTIGWRPFIGPRARTLTSRRFETTAARMERGEYLVEKVMGCFFCHSERDWNAPGAPPIEGRKGAGAIFSGGPGKLFAPNITSDDDSGVGGWSDDALARAIREGVDNDGRTIFPIMPYQNYRHLSDEDLASVIVYLRSIPGVHNHVPRSEIRFPVNLLVNNIPQPITAPVLPPDTSDAAKRGAYLVQMASCTDCHTPYERGQPIEGLAFAGGFTFNEPSGETTSANITPDPSGISYYDENTFFDVMRNGKVGGRKLNPTMPFALYGRMTDDDLRAVLAFLRNLTPVKHRVDNTEPPTPCRLCKGRHGLGDKN